MVIKARFSFTESSFRNALPKNGVLLIGTPFFLLLWVYTFLETTDYSNWWIENILVFISLAVLIPSYKSFQFSDMSYALILLFLCLHVYGSQHTYAENPFGFWLKDALDLQRNQYDRIVHFSFGFLLAYPIRELLLNHFKLSKGLSLILPVEFTLSLSGLYEVIEWMVADIFFTEQGHAYLGTQGDIWDPQKDMFLATLGAFLAIFFLWMYQKRASKT